MLAAVISIVLAAVFAPVLHRVLGKPAGFVLAAVPAILFVVFAMQIPAVQSGERNLVTAAGAAMTAPADASAPAPADASSPSAEDASAGADSESKADSAHKADGEKKKKDVPLGGRTSGVLESHQLLPDLGIAMRFRLDGLSLLFALLITGIGALVLVYTSGYLAGHWQLGRFYATLLAFMASMLGVVLADDIIGMFIFWELTSITSFLLIGFDHHRAAARRAATQALVVTAGGGLAMLAGLILLASAGGTFSIGELINSREAVQASHLFMPAMVLVLLGCFTKSAQFPFHFWLPNAMEAPTPVSSYLHSATMVKAGVYLIARMNPVFGGTSAGWWETALVTVACVTMVVVGVIALRQYALKKLLACSTTASLSVMILCIGLGSQKGALAAMAFLLAHALYKCALFQTAGNITHATGEKDVKKLSGLRPSMPIAGLAGILAGASMIGIPFVTLGYFGKEYMVTATWGSPIAPLAVTACAMFAGMVFVMIGWATGVRPFIGDARDTKEVPHEPGSTMLAGPLVLGVLGIVGAIVLPWTGDAFVVPATDSVRGADTQAHVTWWHGFTIPLLLDVLVLAGGAVFAWKRLTVERAMEKLDGVFALGPDRQYDRFLGGLRGLAGFSTRTFQSGSLPWYLVTVLVFAVGVVGYAIRDGLGEFAAMASELKPTTSDFRGHEVLTCIAIVLGCYALVRTKSRLSAVGALGLVGYGIALLFVFFGAPDLAITQFLVETLSVVLLVLVFYRMPAFKQLTSRAHRLRDVAIASVVGMTMTVLVIVATQAEIGTRDARDYYAETSYINALGRNVVNVILVDYRAIDTMGEIVVLMIAALGVFALIRVRPGQASPAEDFDTSSAMDGGASPRLEPGLAPDEPTAIDPSNNTSELIPDPSDDAPREPSPTGRTVRGGRDRGTAGGDDR